MRHPHESPLRIGIDTHGCQGIATGLGRYIASLLTCWLARPTQHEFHVFCCAADVPAFQVPGHDQARWHIGGDWHRRALPDIAWHACELPPRARELGLDVLFIHSERRIPPWSQVPVVATVHDLAAHELPGKYATLNQLYSTRIVPRLLTRVQRLIAVSQTTAAGITARFSIPPDRITVIPNGVDAARFARGPTMAKAAPPSAGRGIRQPYVLFPGRIEHPAKNHVTAIAAIAALRDQGRDLALVCAGQDWLRAEVVHAEVDRLGVRDRVFFTGFVPDADLVELYHGATALLFPSRVEGFGLPLVEAMAAGIPIVASRASCIPEIAGDAALYAEPDDVAGFAAALTTILDDAATRTRLLAAGAERVQLYSWARCADQTLAVLTAAAEHR